MFVVSLRVQVNEEWYSKCHETGFLSRFHMLSFISHLGDKSFHWDDQIVDNITARPYATSRVRQVFVNTQTRLPVSLPEEMRKEKLLRYTDPILFKAQTNPENYFTSPFVTVEKRHIDYNNHVNYSIYVLFGIDALASACEKGYLEYGRFHPTNVKIDTLSVLFQSEAVLGSVVHCILWKDDTCNQVNIQLMCGDRKSAFFSLSFHNDTPPASL